MAFPRQLGLLYVVVRVRVSYIVLPCWGGEGVEGGDAGEDGEELDHHHLPSPCTSAGGAEVITDSCSALFINYCAPCTPCCQGILLGRLIIICQIINIYQIINVFKIIIFYQIINNKQIIYI